LVESRKTDGCGGAINSEGRCRLELFYFASPIGHGSGSKKKEERKKG
jgi:hypothetical protein